MACTCYDERPEHEAANDLPHRPFCSICRDVVRVDIEVPCHIWRASLGRQFWNTYVCAGCFARHADERGVNWAPHAKFTAWSQYDDAHLKQQAKARLTEGK